MNIVPNQIFHVYNRGNQRQTIFFEREHYLFFLRKVRQYISPHCSILAYCLMPNHFHLLLQSNEQTVAPSKALRSEGKTPQIDMSNFAHGMKMLLSSYTKGVNKQLGLSGSLFTQNTKAKQVSSEFSSEDYVLSCFLLYSPEPIKGRPGSGFIGLGIFIFSRLRWITKGYALRFFVSQGTTYAGLA